MSSQDLRPPTGLKTLNDIFFSVVDRDEPRVMMRKITGKWEPRPSREIYKYVVGVSRALLRWGLQRGDRVAILSENRPEWAIADFACLLLGAITVPIYTTVTEEQTAHVLCDSGARVIFASSEELMQRVLAIQRRTRLEKLVGMNHTERQNVVRMSELGAAGPDHRDEQFDAAAREIRPDDIATIIYTSGTTGTPKGVVLTHGNMASNIAAWLSRFSFHPGQLSISFLPLSHVTARNVDLGLLHAGVTLAYLPNVNQLPQALLELKPTIMVAVPRVYEKIHAQVDQKANAIPKKWIYGCALFVGRRHRSEIVTGKTPRTVAWRLANRLVYSKIRAGMGGCVETFISGGAPLGRELAEWYANVGIRIHEGYGLTETSPVIAVNTATAHKLGTVGQPLENVQVRIAEDGEILVRGPSVFQGYWNKPDETQNAFVDGWFKTGDIGTLDEDGFLSVPDRKKDLIKTSGGKFIAPQPIENSLKHNPLIAEAVILGDKHKFPAVLISPHFAALEDWARNNDISFPSRQQLVDNAKVRALYQGIVDQVNGNLARFEKLKRVLLVPDEFTAQNGTLTASMKIRRRAVEERYREQIEKMYADAEASSQGQQPS
jgi:long-chain acyl-CoA synthetase